MEQPALNVLTLTTTALIQENLHESVAQKQIIFSPCLSTLQTPTSITVSQSTSFSSYPVSRSLEQAISNPPTPVILYQPALSDSIRQHGLYLTRPHRPQPIPHTPAPLIPHPPSIPFSHSASLIVPPHESCMAN